MDFGFPTEVTPASRLKSSTHCSERAGNEIWSSRACLSKCRVVNPCRCDSTRTRYLSAAAEETVDVGGSSGDGPGTCRDLAGQEQGLFLRGLVARSSLFFCGSRPSITATWGTYLISNARQWHIIRCTLRRLSQSSCSIDTLEKQTTGGSFLVHCNIDVMHTVIRRMAAAVSSARTWDWMESSCEFLQLGDPSLYFLDLRHPLSFRRFHLLSSFFRSFQFGTLHGTVSYHTTLHALQSFIPQVTKYESEVFRTSSHRSDSRKSSIALPVVPNVGPPSKLN